MNYDFNNSNQFLNQIVDLLPRLAIILLILILGFLVALFFKTFSHRFFKKIKLDQIVENSPISNLVSNFKHSLSSLFSLSVYWIIYIYSIILAISVLDIGFINNLLAYFYSYLPNIILSIIILISAIIGSTYLVKFIEKAFSPSPLVGILKSSLPAIILALAGFMILNQLSVSREIILILFGAIVFSIGLGMAIAFGLGGKEIARDILGSAYTQAKKDLSKESKLK